MKNYSTIKDPKDIVTKEYVDNLIRTISGVLNTNGWILENKKYRYKFAISDIKQTNIPTVYIQYNISENTTYLLPYVESFDGYVYFYATAPLKNKLNFILQY